MADDVKTITDEIQEHHRRVEALILLATKEDRESTEEEQKEITERRGRLEALVSKRRRGETFDELLRAVRAVAAPPEGNGHAGAPRPAGARPAPLAGPRSLGQQFTEHDVYAQMIRGVQRSGRWQSPTFEIQAAGVTLVPAGAAIPPGTMPPVPVIFPAEWSVAGRFSQGTTDAGLIPYLRETVWTNAAAVVAMGAAKPQSTKEFTLVQQPLVKIAHYIDCPDELLDDVQGLQSFIDAQMELGVLEALENQIINGPGGAGQIQGLMTLPGIVPPVVWTAGPYVNAILAQRAAVYEASRLRPDTVVMSPTTAGTVMGQTTETGGWLFGPAMATGTVRPMIGGMDVVESPSVPDATAIVGAFKQGGQLFRKGGVTVQATNSHAANFVSNITTIRAEIRVALAYYRSTAFGLVTGVVAGP